jgi:hypothetical protein
MGQVRVRRFWDWYERHYALNVAVAFALFLLQLVHLAWLSADVVAERLTGTRYLPLPGLLRLLIVAVDYTEIPAILSVSLIYLNQLRDGLRWRPLVLLTLLNSQWLHLFWITDEFVVTALTGSGGSALPNWLAWVAIAIDYLELPVMWDTAKELSKATGKARRPRRAAPGR